MNFRTYALRQACAALSTEWYQLLRAGGLELSLSPEWLLSTAESQERTENVRVVAWEHNGEVVGILPYLMRRVRMFGLPVSLLELPGSSLVNYHQEVISQKPESILRAALGNLNEKWHVFLIPNVVQGKPTANALEKIVAASNLKVIRYSGQCSPYFSITEDWESYLASKSSNFRYTLKRKERALLKQGVLEERWFESSGDVDELYAVMLQIESLSWKASAQMAISGSEIEKRYYKNLLPFLSECGALFANVLYLNKRPIAYSLGYFWNNKVGQLKTSFDQAFAGASPGLVINHFAIRRAFECGAGEFDFLGPDMTHKMHWANCARQHISYYIYSDHLRSRLIGLAKRLQMNYAQR